MTFEIVLPCCCNAGIDFRRNLGMTWLWLSALSVCVGNETSAQGPETVGGLLWMGWDLGIDQTSKPGRLAQPPISVGCLLHLLLHFLYIFFYPMVAENCWEFLMVRGRRASCHSDDGGQLGSSFACRTGATGIDVHCQWSCFGTQTIFPLNVRSHRFKTYRQRVQHFIW